MTVMDVSYDVLKGHIGDALKGCGANEEALSKKVVEFVHHLKPMPAREPGLCLVTSLEDIIKQIIIEAVNQKCDLIPIIKGIIIGTFRANRNVRDEAHKTIDRLVEFLILDAIDQKVQLEQAVEGLLKGFEEAAKEKDLNVGEALKEVEQDALIAVEKNYPQLKAQIEGIFKTIKLKL
jgi:hypothetical protein